MNQDVVVTKVLHSGMFYSSTTSHDSDFLSTVTASNGRRYFPLQSGLAPPVLFPNVTHTILLGTVVQHCIISSNDIGFWLDV